jgi:antitoxin component YwqK of YwqJK toxin-antitoxin module
LYFEDGNLKYEGTFSHGGVYHGNGTEYYGRDRHDKIDKIKYYGGFNDGKYHGTGIEYCKTGTIRYGGEFDKGNYHGNGIFYSKTGHIDYEGRLQIGVLDGYGVNYYTNGNLYYKGNRSNGHICDKNAVIYYSNGKIQYHGDINNGKYNGVGIVYRDDGNKKIEGSFNNGIIYGMCKYYYTTGKIDLVTYNHRGLVICSEPYGYKQQIFLNILYKDVLTHVETFLTQNDANALACISKEIKNTLL